MRRVSHYEHAFRAGRGEPVERVPHPEYPEPSEPEFGSGEPVEPSQPITGDAGDAGGAVQVDAGLGEQLASESTAETATQATADPDPAADAPSNAAPPAVASAPLRVEFQSSNVRAAELDAATGVLTVEFANGKQYRYGDFTAELFAEWQTAKSAGSWFDANVKKRPDRHPPLGK